LSEDNIRKKRDVYRQSTTFYADNDRVYRPPYPVTTVHTSHPPVTGVTHHPVSAAHPVATAAGKGAYYGAKVGSTVHTTRPVATAATVGAYYGAKSANRWRGKRSAHSTTTYCSNGYCYSHPNYYPNRRGVARPAVRVGTAAYVGARAGARRGKRSAHFFYRRPALRIGAAAYIGARAGARRGSNYYYYHG